MLKRKSKAAAILMLALTLALPLSGCADKTLQQSASELNKILKITQEVETTVIQANSTGLLNDNQTRAVLEVCKKIAEGGQVANNTVAGLSKLDPATKSSLDNVLQPVNAAVQSLDPALLEQLASIKDPTTQATVTSLIAAIKVSLAILTVNFGGGA